MVGISKFLIGTMVAVSVVFQIDGVLANDQSAHKIVRKSLVHLLGTGTPQTGQLAGREKGAATQGTGFFVSKDGFILTSSHFFDPLKKVDAVHVVITGAIKGADSSRMRVLFVSDLPSLDMVLLKANIPLDRPEAIPLPLGRSGSLNKDDDVRLLWSGFEKNVYDKHFASIVERRNQIVPYAWTIKLKTDRGNSGSPVYIEKADDTVEVIGLIKGSNEENSDLSNMIPIEYALPLIGHIKIQELDEKNRTSHPPHR